MLNIRGALLKVIGQPGTGYGELSSPSGVAASKTRLYATTMVRQHECRIMAFDLQTWRVVATSREEPQTEQRTFDAPEGMAEMGGMLYIVDSGRHRVVACDALSLAVVDRYPPSSIYRGDGHSVHASDWYLLYSPQGIVAHDGELFVADTHNDRIQVPFTPVPAHPRRHNRRSCRDANDGRTRRGTHSLHRCSRAAMARATR